ncbi:FRIGIDA-like protein [Quillaja saponaria]|uniref:FRIGIDA-like protein n=1 Tax=Quillaja saponaria TaxID=32244 RepID=A0AAD7Q235_QUISA|nr:FRIGIDA-like protein [Quillaja saponaria]
MLHEVSIVLRKSLDPAKLVLDAMLGFYAPHSNQGDVEYDKKIIRRSCILLLDELKKASPVINSHVKEEAMNLACEWRVKMNVADEEGLEVMAFLKLLAAYELASSFNAMEVQHLLDVLEQRRRATGLHQDLGNAEKSPVPEGIAVQDGRVFQLNSNEHLNGHYLTGNQVLDALKIPSDPAKLVLDTIQFSLKEGNGEIVFGGNVCLLSWLMRVFPKISPHVKEVAMKLAGQLKANVRANGENSLGVLALLQLTAIYGLSTLFMKMKF